MKYNIQLIGGKEVVASEEQVNMVVQHWRLKDGMVLAVGPNTINVNTVRSITEIPEVNFKKFEEKKRLEDQEYDRYLEAQSKQTREEKSKREMTVRVVPAWKLSGGRREDEEMMVIYRNALTFFTDFPHYPYFPSRIWIDVLKPRLRDSVYVSLLFLYIARHDQRVDEWVKLRKLPIADHVQMDLGA